MPNLLSRFRRRATSLPVTEVAEQQPAIPGPSSSQSEAVLDQKIHPNLAELVNDFPPVFFSQPTPIPEPKRPSTSAERDDGIIPLKPAGRTRRRSSDTSAKRTPIVPAKATGQLEKLPESPTSSHPALPDAADVPHDTQQASSQGVSAGTDSARDNDDGITPAMPAVTRRRSNASAMPSTTAAMPFDDLQPSRTPSHPASLPDASDIIHDIIYSNDCSDPTRSPSSLSASSFQETVEPSHENSNSPAGSGTFGVFTRLTNLVHGSPATPLTQSPNPPSSWSTFGRRVIRGGRSASHPTDVGTGSRPSSSGTSNSHTPPSTTRSRIGTPENTPGSAFGSISSPSSGFTFGSHGPGTRALGSSPPPPLPPLDHPAFGTLNENNSNVAIGHDGSKDGETTFFSDHGPRPSSSMPAMRSNAQPNSSWLTESSSRPRLQDIFSSPVSSPTTSRRTSRRSTASRGSNSQRRRRSKSASSSRKHGKIGGERHDISGQGSGRVVVTPSENGNQARGNSTSQVVNLGSPFLLQNIPAAYSPLHNHPDTTILSLPSHENSEENLMSIDAVPGISNAGNSKTRSQPRKGGIAKPQVSSSARASMVPAAPAVPPIPSPRSTSDQPSGLMVPPLLSVTGPTPEPSPLAEPRTPPPSSEKARGKRKADEVEGGTPPEAKKNNKTTFAAEAPRPHRASGNSTVSYAPSSYQSYHRHKRARLSGVMSMSAVGEDKYTYITYHPNPSGSFGSRGSSSGRQGHPRTHSRPSSFRPKPSSISGSHQAPSRRSISQASIPISALISPHAPSISQWSTRYHMRDPRKPPRVQPTPWTLSFPAPGEGEVGYFQKWKWWKKENRAHTVGWADGGGSPLHAWLFFLGFVLFPIWWVAGLLVRIPETRRIGDADTLEKGVVLDDPQVEHDAKSWRNRCRIMAAVSLVTYVPFIVLVAVFAR